MTLVDAAWIAPSLVLGAGAALAAVILRRIGEAIGDVNASQRRLHRLEDSLIPLRVENRRVRQSSERFPR